MIESCAAELRTSPAGSIEPSQLTRDQITALLFGDTCDNEQEGDCIYVFGGHGSERADKAVQLYLSGRAPRIVFTGGTKEEGVTPEAVRMRDFALQQGVPESHILVKPKSKTTQENVVYSLPILEQNFGLRNIKRLLVVSVPWHRRRGLLTLRTYMPSWIEYAWHPANYPEHQPDNWWKTPEVERYVMTEVSKLAACAREGLIADGHVKNSFAQGRFE